jgi:hypothetical protein
VVCEQQASVHTRGYFTYQQRPRVLFVHHCCHLWSSANSPVLLLLLLLLLVSSLFLLYCSWGSATGDRGYFRVKYGVCGIMTPMALGDNYGVFYLPDNLKTLEVAGAAPSRQGKHCYVYRVSWFHDRVSVVRCFGLSAATVPQRRPVAGLSNCRQNVTHFAECCAYCARYRAPCCTIYQARKEDSLAKIADRTVVSIGHLLSDIQVIKSFKASDSLAVSSHRCCCCCCRLCNHRLQFTATLSCVMLR